MKRARNRCIESLRAPQITIRVTAVSFFFSRNDEHVIPTSQTTDPPHGVPLAVVAMFNTT